MQINLICETCKKEFKRSKNRVIRYNHHFCSRECASKSHIYRGGWKLTKESKDKIRKSHLGKKQSIKTVNRRKETILNRYGKNWRKLGHHPNWKGGIIKSCGYKLVRVENHPFSNGKGYIMEHRLIMEKYLGRYLEKKEIVHHKNRIRDDNRIENLILVTNKTHWGKIKCPKCHFEFGIH